MTTGTLHTVNGTQFFAGEAGAADAAVQLIWAHGWGQSGDSMLPLASSLASFASSTVLDFPGFGQSPAPPLTWGTAEYADQIAVWLQTQPPRCRVWIGHSFGCRVGMQLAARHPGVLNGLVLTAAAGLQRNRPWPQKLRYNARKYSFKLAKAVLPQGPALNKLRARMGSSDYRNAGALRPILSRVVAEDLTEVAKKITCPTLLVYGANDTDTPPEIGQRLEKLIPKAKLEIMDGFDHLSLLLDGRHQVVSRVKSFVEKTVQCS